MAISRFVPNDGTNPPLRPQEAYCPQPDPNHFPPGFWNHFFLGPPSQVPPPCAVLAAFSAGFGPAPSPSDLSEEPSTAAVSSNSGNPSTGTALAVSHDTAEGGSAPASTSTADQSVDRQTLAAASPPTSEASTTPSTCKKYDKPCFNCCSGKLKCSMRKPCKHQRRCIYQKRPGHEVTSHSMQMLAIADHLLMVVHQLEDRIHSMKASIERVPSGSQALLPQEIVGHSARASCILNLPSVAKLIVPVMRRSGLGNLAGFPLQQELQRIHRRPPVRATAGTLVTCELLGMTEAEVLECVASFDRGIQSTHALFPQDDLKGLTDWFCAERGPETCDKCPVITAVFLMILAIGRVCLPQSRRVLLREPSMMQTHPHLVPGLQLYCYAMAMVGIQEAEYSLDHAHVNILAALYCGQIGWVVDSWTHIGEAGKILHILLQTGPNRHPNGITIDGHKGDELIRAYWICIHVECDILDEISLPPSRLITYDRPMPCPNLKDAAKNEYLQLHLRKQKEVIHLNLYGTSGAPSRRPITLASLVNHFEPGHLGDYREVLDDGPAKDLPEALVCAGYWGARALIYRAFVTQILTFHHNQTTGENVALVDDGVRMVDMPVIPPGTSDITCVDPRIKCLAEKGIHALIERTRVFYSIPHDELILANPFGEGVTQWGNIILLAAASRDRFLGQFVPKRVLAYLIHKTVSSCMHIVDPMGALAKAMRILLSLRGELDLPELTDEELEAPWGTYGPAGEKL